MSEAIDLADRNPGATEGSGAYTDLLCDAFLPSYYAPLTLRQEQEKNRAARRLRSGAARTPRRAF
jgi:hypothetical protein